MTRTKIFTRDDIGCWIDGAYGIDHAADKLAAMLLDCGETAAAQMLAVRDEDFISDEIDDATELLDQYTAEGLSWYWTAGDLILTDDPEAF